MDTTVIVLIIIATVVALIVVALVIILFYYHWRNKDLMVNFTAFIRENLQLKDEIGRLQEENDELNDELDEVTGGTRGGRYPYTDRHHLYNNNK